jgi:CSLREA domain-containing protein
MRTVGSLLIALTFFAFALALLPPTANASGGTTFLVTRLDDPAPGVCDPGDCSLREAIIAANLVPDNTDNISITIPGTVELSITGVDENNAATGDLDILGSTNIVGQGAEITIIDANGIDRVFDIHAPAPVNVEGASVSTVSDLTITGGNVVTNKEFAGGGVRVNSGHTVTLRSVVVRDNGVFGMGGGVANNAGTLWIDRSAIVTNIGRCRRYRQCGRLGDSFQQHRQ